MHVLVLLVGAGDPDEMMAPWAESLAVEPYTNWMEEFEIEALAQHVGLDPANAAGLVEHVEEWAGHPGVHEGDRLGYTTTANPDAMYDWLQRGGRFSGYLKLREPRPSGIWRRLRGLGPITGVDTALKGEVDLEPMYENPPFAIVLDGVWYDQDGSEDGVWGAECRALLEPVPDSVVLQVIDAHC